MPFCAKAGDAARLEAFGCFHPGFAALVYVKLQPRCAALRFSACIYAADLLEELHAAPQWLLLGGSGRSAAPGDALGALSAGGPGLVLLGLINRHLNL